MKAIEAFLMFCINLLKSLTRQQWIYYIAYIASNALCIGLVVKFGSLSITGFIITFFLYMIYQALRDTILQIVPMFFKKPAKPTRESGHRAPALNWDDISKDIEEFNRNHRN